MKFNLILILTSILAFTQSTLAGENAVTQQCPTLNRDQITTLIKQSKYDLKILRSHLKECETIIDGSIKGLKYNIDPEKNCDLFDVNKRKYRLLPLTEHNENFGRRHGIKALNSSGDTYEGTPYPCIAIDANKNNKKCWAPPKGLLLKKIAWRDKDIRKNITDQLNKDSIGKQLDRLKLTMKEWERRNPNLYKIFIKHWDESSKKQVDTEQNTKSIPEILNSFLHEPKNPFQLKQGILDIPDKEGGLSRKEEMEVFVKKLDVSWNNFCQQTSEKDEKCSFNPLKFYNSQKTPLHCVYYHHPLGRKEPIITRMEEFDDSYLKEVDFED